MTESLKQFVQKIEKLPTLPVIAQEILGLVSDDTTSVNKIEKIVENDPAISAKILSVANSAYFGVKSKTKTLDSAIMRIGFSNVKSIALGISLMTVLQDGVSNKALDYKRIFNHSVTTGFVAKVLSKKLRMEFADEIMVNGMLHDIGYLTLNKYLSDTYMEVLDLFNRDISLIEAEKEVMGFTHSEVGKWLSEKWNLPNSIRDTICYHHEPSEAPRNAKRVAIIHLADYITTDKLLSPTEKNPNYSFDPKALEILGISESDYADLEAQISGEAYSDEMLG